MKTDLSPLQPFVRRRSQAKRGFQDVTFDLPAYKRALHAENIVSALGLVRQLISKIQETDSLNGCFLDERLPTLNALATEVERQIDASGSISAQGSRFFAQILTGLHQPFFKMCLKRKKVGPVLEYAELLPPDPYLFSQLLKACLDYGDLRAVTRAVEVSHFAPVPNVKSYFVYMFHLWPIKEAMFIPKSLSVGSFCIETLLLIYPLEHRYKACCM